MPELRLYSGRVLDDSDQSDLPLIENRVTDAVRYFVEEYGCRVFNLSYGDLNKPYLGGRVAGLAVTLDALSRELGVLFVVPTGNYTGEMDSPGKWLAEYPPYLTSENAGIIDPAPALNALTVGSLARYERGGTLFRYPDDPSYRVIARPGQPSPFTRCGPSVNGAIKPELVDYGGNRLIHLVHPDRIYRGDRDTGEVSTSRDFALGRPFAQDSGTSFAAPRVAHAAAKILAEVDASPNLCRALLVAHAQIPSECSDLFAGDSEGLIHVSGYGYVNRSALYRSLDQCVPVWSEDRIEDRRHHFYEIPIPEVFWEGGKRERKLTIALAYCPAVRTTRIGYRASNLSYRLVQGASLGQVVRDYDTPVPKVAAARIRERSGKRRFSERVRSKGTVQASAWLFNQVTPKTCSDSWVVVATRNDPSWGKGLSAEQEAYALVVVLSDRLVQQVHLQRTLYAAVRQRVQARSRVRG